MTKISLEALKEFFLKEEYQAEIEAGTEVSPKQLVVLFGRDTKGQDLFLHLTLLDETTKPPPEEKSLHFLQFYSLFPYEIKESALSEMARLILSINASFDLAGFGMMEGNKLFFYRYVHICEAKTFSDDVLHAIVDSMSLLFETFLPSLTDVASGKKTIDELQQETKEAIRTQEFEIL